MKTTLRCNKELILQSQAVKELQMSQKKMNKKSIQIFKMKMKQKEIIKWNKILQLENCRKNY